MILYLGHFCAWMCACFARILIGGGSMKLLDALLISAFMAIFSASAHAIFGG